MPLPLVFENPSLLIEYMEKNVSPDSVTLLIGEFDLFHAGHQPLLAAAKENCETLLIGLFPDLEFNKKYGNDRPFVPFLERAEMLLGTRYVDLVIDLSCGIDDLLKQFKPGRILAPSVSHAKHTPVQHLFERIERSSLQFIESTMDEMRATEFAIARISEKLQISNPSKSFLNNQQETVLEWVKPKSLPILESDRLSLFIQECHERDEFLVTSNGSFDILHPGHLRYLRKAKALGGTFLVLVNDDESIRHSKGTQRPIFRQEERLTALAALECVDYVVPFSGDNPLYLIDQIKPDIHVKGGSFEETRVAEEKRLVEYHGGRFQCFDLIENFSTTKILQTFIDLYKKKESI
ncbi:MAG: adenylyltransferase/cytidyltransferase family protein [SAR324 cluster bacterium]|nr:adenylyltransferase/cytidyltransferase family protein [SAR324 cluster bacterium]